MFDSNLFTVAFQPVVSLKTSEVIFYEALLRHSSYANIQDFITLAEQSDRIGEIDFFVFERCLREIEEKKKPAVSINFSVRTLEIFGYRIVRRLREFKYADAVIIEITESREIANWDLVKNFVLLIQRTKARVAIDDYADGFANDARVIAIKPDIIKVSFSTTCNEKLPSLMTLSKLLNASIVVERIETELQRKFFFDLGFEYGQGYYFGKPA